MSIPMAIGGGVSEDFLARPLRETTPDELTQLFLAGEKPRDRWLVGLELELTPHLIGSHGFVPYELVARVMESLAAGGGYEKQFEATGELIGLNGSEQVISLEPGCQLEVSTRPYRALKRLCEAMERYADSLRKAGAEHGVGFWAIGHHPFANRDTIPKVPKDRYRVMRQYMPTRGTRGLDMMHLTGSIQCAVDFDGEATLASKIRTAAKVGPYLAALTASSPFFEGRPNGFMSNRYEIWRDTDNSRSGLWPEMVDAEGLTYRRYVERALRTPAMLFRRNGRYVIAEAKPFAQYAEDGFEGTVVTVADFLDHMTTLFPEVRVKSYVELRSMDCMKPLEAVAVAGFWRGILDDEETRAAVDERLETMGFAELVSLQRDVARLGLAAMSAAGNVGEVIRFIVRAGYERLSRATPDCADCVLPLLRRAEEGRSPSDDMLLRLESGGIDDALSLVEV